VDAGYYAWFDQWGHYGYTVNVASNGWYDLNVRYTTFSSAARITVYVDGVAVVNAVQPAVMPTRTTYGNHIVRNAMYLTAGEHIIAVAGNASLYAFDWRFNWFEIQPPGVIP
jgi:hypothetical protein